MTSIACVEMGDDQRQTVLMDVTGLRLSNPRFTREVFDHLLSLYDKVVEAVYQSRIKDSKKLAEALEDDRWRYQELPETLAEDDARITKPQLERLVRWKCKLVFYSYTLVYLSRTLSRQYSTPV